MNLTEPHCGTDLGLLRTRAEPREDGTYRITGTKGFISAGEHDLTENIIHLVLARIAGAPAGTRGISLFIVPKFLIGPDGGPGERNAVACGSIERKMGIKASATCTMNYDGATGYLLGEENRGLRAMFTMMNRARLGVGVQGLALGEVAYQNAAAYARERRQGRAPSGGGPPDAPPDPIIVHPDVRRMLMTMRAFTEGGRALALWTAFALDTAHHDPDERCAPRRRGPGRARHPRRQGLADGHGLRGDQSRSSGSRRRRLHPRDRGGAVRAGRQDHADLRRHERRPGSRPRGPQDPGPLWPRAAAGVPSDRSGSSPKPPGTRT